MKPTLQISLLVACTVWATSPAWPDAEDLKVQQVITDLAGAYMAFPQTRDRHSLLKYFAQDYSFIDEAGPHSLQDIERMLADLEQELTRGPVVITEQISEIAVHVEGLLAWATYWDRVTIAQHGDISDDVAHCTAIFRKLPTGWVYQHEHCSSHTLDKDAEHNELTKLTRHLDQTVGE
jgi:ketosteroid isomerase-like protein